MKKFAKVFKGLLCTCMAVTLLLGAGVQAEASEPERTQVEWADGLIKILNEGETIRFTNGQSSDVQMYANDNIDMKLSVGWYMDLDYEMGLRKIVCSIDESGNLMAKFYFEGYVEPVSSSPSSSSPCHHDWIEEIIKYATQTEDGIVANKCKYCGEIQNGSKHIVSGYEIFNKDTAKAVRDAKESAVTISTDRWVSFSKEVFAALEARTDVTLTVNYRFENKDYTVTIPAGTKGEGLLDENGFCGFRYLDSIFHGSEVVK